MTIILAILGAIAIATILTATTWKSVEDKTYRQGKQPTAGEFGCTLLLFPILLIGLAIALILVLR